MLGFVNKQECNGRAIMRDSSYKAISTKEHSHDRNQNRVTCFEVFNQMKGQAVMHPEMPPSQIIRKEIQSVSSRELTRLADRAAVKRELNRHRQAGLPAISQKIREVHDISQAYKIISAGIAMKKDYLTI
jgi:hypothetical protein